MYVSYEGFHSGPMNMPLQDHSEGVLKIRRDFKLSRHLASLHVEM